MAGTLLKIGDMLVSLGFIDAATLERAQAVSTRTGRAVSQVLVEIGAMSSADMYRLLSEQLDVNLWHPDTDPPEPQAIAAVPRALAQRHQVIPIKIAGGHLVVALENPTDMQVLELLRSEIGMAIVPWIASPESIKEALFTYYEMPGHVERAYSSLNTSVASAAQASARERDASRTTNVRSSADQGPIVELIDSLLTEAVRRNSSDIHLEPTDTDTRIRYRIDGLLEERGRVPSLLHDAMLSRLKILSSMDIAEKRVPQDGRFSVDRDGVSYDLRLSTLPTVHGEKIVIRLLRQSSESLDLGLLGISPKVLEGIQTLLNRPQGMLIVAGPTGSGKSTTLASALRYINKSTKNIVTVEDPVEYLVPGVNQSQVNIRAGMTFALALKYILRQDPDSIMIGEIRDSETADIALRAALTGHLVLATIHSNSALGAFSRLEDMGANKYIALSAISGVVSQRLVRVLCPTCKVPWSPPAEELAEIMSYAPDPPDILSPHHLFRPGENCPGCEGRGYRGRTVISEIIKVDDNFRAHLLTSHDREADAVLNPAKRSDGLLSDGARKVLSGVTTWAEVLRVAGSGE